MKRAGPAAIAAGPAPFRAPGPLLLALLLLVHVLLRVGVELVPAAGAAHVVRLPVVRHGNCPQPAGDDALVLLRAGQRRPFLGQLHLGQPTRDPDTLLLDRDGVYQPGTLVV